MAQFLGLFGLIGWSSLSGGGAADADPARADRPLPLLAIHDAEDAPPAPAIPKRRSFPAEVDIRKATLEAGRYVQDLGDGSRVVLTHDPAVQQAAARQLARTKMQFGALVAIEPSTGRVLAFAEKVGNPKLGIPRPALSAQHPAASVFKLVSAAALLTEAGIKPSRRVCVHGGRRRLGKREIEGDPRRDRRCRRFGTALGHSDNSVFARLAYTELEPAALARVAEDFGFGGAPDLPWPVEPSTFDLPSDDLHEYARAAAGFWHSKLSPAHAASMTAALANRGVVMRVHHVDTWMAADGSVRYRAEPTATGRVVDKRTAGVLTRMMVETTTKGTARKIFSGKHWPWRRSLEVAGKTGSLTRRKPTTVAYSWFVGFAPADDPEIAVAALVANGDRWWIKAGHLARTSLAAWRRSRRGPKNRGQRS